MALDAGREQQLKSYLNKNESIQESVILKKVTCCFTNQRLSLVKRKQLGFKRYFVDLPYHNVTKVEFFRTFNYTFFLYGIFLLLTAITQRANPYVFVALASTAFVIVFFFQIHGMQPHHQEQDPAKRLEILGTRKELSRVVPLLQKYNVLTGDALDTAAKHT